MDSVADLAFVQAIPKVELHLHIEGSLEPEMLFALSQRNNVKIPFASAEEVRKAYSFTCLQDFLDIYYQGMSVLLKEQDFYDLTMAYFARLAQDNVVHTELFFDPQGHTDRGVAFETVIMGITRAMKDAEKKYLITSQLIMCFLRHLTQDAAFETLKQATPWITGENKTGEKLIVGIGLDSSEKGHPPSKFVEVYNKCKEMGLKLVAHAGEEGPAQNVIDAMDMLKIDRIDHGVRAEDDAELMTRLSKCRMGLTMCPLSNQKLQATPDLKLHPAKKFLDAGMCVSLNSDDPAYFGGYMNDNYMVLVKELGLTRRHVAQVAINSFESSFLSEDAKNAWKARIESICKLVQ